MAPQIPAPPRPVPRQSSLRGSQAQQANHSTSVTLQEAPLIKFDSSESPDSDSFDPLVSGKSKTGEGRSGNEDSGNPLSSSSVLGDDPQPENVDEVDGLKFQRNLDSRSSLTRAKAFRRESPAQPLRPSYKDDSPEHSSVTSTPKRELHDEVFDPLSGLDGLSVLDSVGSATPQRNQQEAEERRRKSSQLLLHEWSLDSLANISKGSSMTLPQTSTAMRHHTTNPFLVGNHQFFPSQQQSRSYQSHYSLAYAGSGPLPPPGRLPTSFLAPFTQVRSAAPLPPSSNLQRTGSSPFNYGSPSHKPAAARIQGQSINPNPFAPTSGRLLPAPALSSSSGGGTGINRRTLPAVPSSGIVTGASDALRPGGSDTLTAAPAKSQADILSDLIGIDFGKGSSQSAHPPHQQQQCQTQPPPSSSMQSQQQWETFE